MTNPKFEVGQTVYVKWRRSYNSDESPLEPVVVGKIGRKWAFFGNYKFHVKDLYVDGGEYTSPGKVYLSEDDYEKECVVTSLWSEINNKVGHRRPEHLSIKDMNTILSLLEGGQQ